MARSTAPNFGQFDSQIGRRIFDVSTGGSTRTRQRDCGSDGMPTADYGQVVRSHQPPQEVDHGSSAADDADDGSVHRRIGGIDAGHYQQVNISLRVGGQPFAGSHSAVGLIQFFQTRRSVVVVVVAVESAGRRRPMGDHRFGRLASQRPHLKQMTTIGRNKTKRETLSAFNY